MQKKFLALLIYAATSLPAVSGQTGGSFDLSHNVIASGGGASLGGAFRLDGTIGQGIAGTTSSGGQFSLIGGFWTPTPFAPTAASVTVSGRARTANGVGIRNVIVRLSASDGSARTTVTNTFGYFRFANVGAGETYVISASSRRYSFENPILVLNVHDDVASLDFVAQ